MTSAVARRCCTGRCWTSTPQCGLRPARARDHRFGYCSTTRACHYDPRAPETTEFFKIVQNKLHYAAHGQTSAEVIAARADATKPNMGLTSFSGERPRKSDVTIAKNYLGESELKKLNTLVSAYFDAAEFRAQNHEPTYMSDWLAHLDRLIVAMDAPVLRGSGSVSRERAVAHAEGEYAKYRAQLATTPTEVEEAYLESIKRAQREIEGKK